MLHLVFRPKIDVGFYLMRQRRESAPVLVYLELERADSLLSIIKVLLP
jgi:hypothetical protein